MQGAGLGSIFMELFHLTLAKEAGMAKLATTLSCPRHKTVNLAALQPNERIFCGQHTLCMHLGGFLGLVRRLKLSVCRLGLEIGQCGVCGSGVKGASGT